MTHVVVRNLERTKEDGMRGFVVGVDLGGTQVRAMLTDEEGTPLKRANTLTLAHEGPQKVMARVHDCIRQVLEGTEPSAVLGIGIGAPGTVNPWTGILTNTTNIPGLDDWPLRDQLANQFRLPVFVGNDAKLAALGEHQFGAGKNASSLVYLTISTGIGGGVIDGGRLLLGAHGWATELGHIIVEPHGPRCACGNIGCLEALANGPAIARHAVELLQSGRTSLLTSMVEGKLDRISAKEVAKAAHEGDSVAVQVMERAAFYLGIGMVTFIHTFDPQLIIVGGGVSKAGDLLFAPVRRIIAERAMTEEWRHTPIVPAALGDDVGLLGAVALVLTETRAA
jgi:glucokinase